MYIKTVYRPLTFQCSNTSASAMNELGSLGRLRYSYTIFFILIVFMSEFSINGRHATANFDSVERKKKHTEMQITTNV